MTTPTLTIEAKGLDKQLAKLAQTDKIVKRELRSGLGRSIKLVKSEVTPKIPVWSGRTVNGFRSKITVQKDGSYLVGKFYNKNPFWLRLVQEGRKGGKAPWNLPERFTAWVADKTGATGSELTATVYRMLHVMQRSGTQQAQGDIVGKAVKSLEGEIQRTFALAIQKIVKLLEVREMK